MKFVDLVKSVALKKGVDNYADFALPGRNQREAARRFEHMFVGKGFYLWNEDRAPRPGETILVVGVNTCIRRDMELLDELASWGSVFRSNGVRVEVFNVYYFQTLEEFEERIPGLGMVYHTPVVGLFENGEWTTRATAHHAQQFIQEYVRRLAETTLDRLFSAPSREPKVLV